MTGPRRDLPLLLAALLLAVSTIGAASARAAEFGGVGLQVVPIAGGELVVLRVLPDSPAAREGMRPGDLIGEVDGFGLEGSDFTTVVREKLWGRPGTEVRLRFRRPGMEGALEAVLERIPMDADLPNPPGVRMLAPGSGE